MDLGLLFMVILLHHLTGAILKISKSFTTKQSHWQEYFRGIKLSDFGPLFVALKLHRKLLKMASSYTDGNHKKDLPECEQFSC